MLRGFKDFISRGNAIDLAVGVIIGAAFSAVVSALTDKFLNPLIGALFGKPNFDSLGQFTIGNSDPIQPGAILTALVNFLIVAAALYFVLVAPMNKLSELGAAKKDDDADDEPEVSDETKLLVEIRDLLERNSGQDVRTGGAHK